MGHVRHRRAVDLDVGLHPDLHARRRTRRRRDELVAGGADHLPRQRDRAGADDAERPRRHASTASRSRSTAARRSACAGAQRAGAAARAASPAAGSASRRGSAARRSTRCSASASPVWETLRRRTSGINAPQLVCFLLFWALNMLVICKGIESIRVLLNIGAAADRCSALALLAWAYARPAASGRCSPSRRRSHRRPQAAVLGVLLPGPDRHGRLLGDALAQHPRLHPLRTIAARPGRRPGARAADDDGACSRSSASRSPRPRVSSTARRSGTRSCCRARFAQPVRDPGCRVFALVSRPGDQHRGQRGRARPTTSPTSGRGGSRFAPAG